MSILNLPFFSKHKIAIVIFALLSLGDLTLTKISLDYMGAIEVNPLMSALFSWSILSAVAFKLMIVTVVALISSRLWSHRKVRLILAAGNSMMLLIVVYQLVNVLKYFYS